MKFYGKFEPVNNPYGYEVREITIENNKPRVKSVSIRKYFRYDLPVFKLMKDIGRKEYFKQFKEYCV